MSLSGAFRKTEKGNEEIKSRAHGLSMRLRPLLILVDGKSTVDELVRRSPLGAELVPQLQQLVDGGFIEPVGAGSSPPAPDAPAPAPAPAASAAGPAGLPASTKVGDLAKARRGALRALHDVLGPMADDFGVRVERAKTPAELLATLESILKLVEGMSGRRTAERLSGLLAAALVD